MEHWKNKIKWAIYKAKRSVRYFFQRLRTGFDDSELYNLDVTVSEFVAPRLKRFKSTIQGHPGILNSMSEWESILDDMIYFHEETAKGVAITYDFKNLDVDRLERGKKYFCEYYHCLWN